MGGKSKSSSSNQTTITEHNTQIENTSMQGEGVFVSGDGNTIHAADAEVLKHLGAGAFGQHKMQYYNFLLICYVITLK